MRQNHRPTHDRTQAYRWTRLVALALVTSSVLLSGLLSAAWAQPAPGIALASRQQRER
jgi:hypothetical protein